MDQRVQCPVCTLYLHSGMSLESHLDTHPKDQVIKALCCLSKSNSSSSNTFSSRTPTPLTSERSYRSRSRTPATNDSGKWVSSHHNNGNERFWKSTPSRTKSTPTFNTSRNHTPDLRISSSTFENLSNNNSSQYSDSYTVKSDKTQQTFGSNAPFSDFDKPYPFFPEQQEDPEIKFSCSSEYSTQIENPRNIFGYTMPIMGLGVKMPSPTTSRKGNDYVKIVPKPGNILLKSNVGGMQYLAPGVKPLHVMMPTTPPFVQKNLQNNMIMSGTLQGSLIMDPKAISSSHSKKFNQITPGTFRPGTTVVTQNSQIIYREMVHNLDGKPFISSGPAAHGSQENVTNVAQSSSVYQNVMVVDQFGNTSYMYTPPHLLSKSNNYFNENVPYMQNVSEKSVPNVVNDANKTLIIEVSPMLPPNTPNNNGAVASEQSQASKTANKKMEREKSDAKNDPLGPTKGLKILSNIKVEVPVQHHKNMLNTVMDLTGSTDLEYPDPSVTPETILPDLDDNSPGLTNYCNQPSTTIVDSLGSSSFSLIKNSSNFSFKESVSKAGNMDNKLDTEFSDSCPVPDLTCNEKPSISPCSELSEHGNNSIDCTSPFPKPESSRSQSTVNKMYKGKKTVTNGRNNFLRLNNIFIKKHKKVLQIRNAKLYLPNLNSQPQEQRESSSNESPENFSMNKIHSDSKSSGSIHTIINEKIKIVEDHPNEFDANTEEQSMDIEPVTPSNENQYTTTVDMIHVKEEVNSSNDFSSKDRSSTDIAPMEFLRPINVTNYSNMGGDVDDELNHRELLELEAASKNKQFVLMMNENYFGDNIYADYFTPDRVEAFEAAKENSNGKENAIELLYVWGESSQKESEFVLPNFIDESYKIAANDVDYSDIAGDNQTDAEVDRCDRDSKVDVLSERSEGEPPLNICSDERMPLRGELSGQESNGDMELPWTGMYSGVPPAEPYDLMARESWVSDASDDDANEKTENMSVEIIMVALILENNIVVA